MSANPFSSPSRSGASGGGASSTSSPDFEVLPPDQPPPSGARSGKHQEALAHLIAYVMDNLLRIPGTKARVGLNPILDILPVFGDGAAAIINAITILEGVRRGVPKIILARMGANVLLNALVGTLPGVGEVFAFWFKPSQRNYNLLLKHGPVGAGATAPKRRVGAGDWLFVVALIAVMLIFIGVFVAVGFYVAYHALHWLNTLVLG